MANNKAVSTKQGSKNVLDAIKTLLAGIPSDLRTGTEKKIWALVKGTK